MKIFKIMLLAGGLAFSGVLLADITGGVGISTDNVFRGVSQSNSDAAITANLGVEYANGFYANVTGYSVESVARDTGVELDVSGGFVFKPVDSTAVDVGIMYYAYPDTDNLNTAEVYTGVEFSATDNVVVGGKISYAPEQNNKASYFYTELDTKVNVGKNVYGLARIGYTNSMTDYGIGAGFTFDNGMNVEGMYTKRDDETIISDGRFTVSTGINF